METATIIVLIGMALSAFFSLVVIACAVASVGNQRIAELDSLEPCMIRLCDQERRGFWTVEADGKKFEVFLTRIESGWLYELNGRWLDANDPRVIAAQQAPSASS